MPESRDEPRRAAGAAPRRRGAPAGAEPEKDKAPVDPALRPMPKLLPGHVQKALRNYYELRPAIELPERLFILQGTSGFYYGDSRPEREVLLGWRPAYVLFTMPL